jgi:hypothetical protein
VSVCVVEGYISNKRDKEGKECFCKFKTLRHILKNLLSAGAIKRGEEQPVPFF